MFSTLTIALPLAVLAPSAVTEPVPEWPDLEPTAAWGLTVADWNGDGVDDVLVNNHRDGFPDLPDWHDLLLVSDGNTWRVELELPFADRHGCTALDADADGRLDFFCAVGADKGHGVGPNELWLQADDGWVEVAEAWGIDNPTARGRHVAAVDWDSDGLDDLFVGVAPHPDLPDQHAAVWLNRGDHFEPVPVEQWGTHCAVPWRGGVVVCDVGPRLGQTAWWLQPDAEPVDLGEYHDAAVAGDQLVLAAEDHLMIDGKSVALPKPTPADVVRANVSTNGSSIYIIVDECSTGDMILVRLRGGWQIGEAPGCATAARHLADGLILAMEGVGRLWLPSLTSGKPA